MVDQEMELPHSRSRTGDTRSTRNRRFDIECE